MTAGAISVRGVSKRFASGADVVYALDDVSIDIQPNEFFTLLGPSGCGKTTLLRLIAGFEEPTAGDILLDDRSLIGLPPFRRPVNTVFQSYALFPHLTVGQNVAFGLEMQRVDPVARTRRVREMLALVRLEAYEQRRPAQLSGGQQQRVALARALANRPQVLLLDEPLSALDLKLRKEMQIELKRLQLETGVTFMFVTHDQEEALTMSDRIAVMQNGQILQVGGPAEIYEHPKSRFIADFIGATNFLEAECMVNGTEGVRLRLDSGAMLEAAEPASVERGQRVTLAVRPERAALEAAGGGGLPGTLETVVYLGTDTTYHVRLDTGTGFQVRVQNRAGAGRHFQQGEVVAVSIPADAVRVLAD